MFPFTCFTISQIFSNICFDMNKKPETLESANSPTTFSMFEIWRKRFEINNKPLRNHCHIAFLLAIYGIDPCTLLYHRSQNTDSNFSYFTWLLHKNKCVNFWSLARTLTHWNWILFRASLRKCEDLWKLEVYRKLDRLTRIQPQRNIRDSRIFGKNERDRRVILSRSITSTHKLKLKRALSEVCSGNLRAFYNNWVDE